MSDSKWYPENLYLYIRKTSKLKVSQEKSMNIYSSFLIRHSF